jgi:septation ring formation regulator EzrA
MKLEVHVHIHNHGNDSLEDEILEAFNSLHRKVDLQMQEIQDFKAAVEASLNGVKDSLTKIAADEQTLIDKITQLQTSPTLSDEDKAALDEVKTLAQSIADQASSVDANVPDAPTA